MKNTLSHLLISFSVSQARHPLESADIRNIMSIDNGLHDSNAEELKKIEPRRVSLS
jgi:hypothetical protein